MNRREDLRAELLKLCAQPGPGDGLDPRDEARKGEDRKARKRSQLAREAVRALQLALQAADHALLGSVLIDTVSDEGAVLRVTVRHADPERARAALAAANGWLRDELARGINRKRVPALRFEVLPPNAHLEGEEGADD